MLRLGIIDMDSSHSIEFTRRFNRCGVDADQIVDGATVVLGYAGESLMSPERVPGFRKQVLECGVELVDSPEAMIGRIDAVLVLSICGDAHLARVRPFLEAGIPSYVDKPFACTLKDAAEMVDLAQRRGVPMFTSSSLRYSHDLIAFREKLPALGGLHGAISWGPAKRHPGNPGLFHYGIHAVEVLYSLMGTGCEEVSATWSEDAEVVTGRWSDGRLGTVRGIRRGCTGYGGAVFCEAGIVPVPACSQYAYRNLCRAMVETFTSGKPAVPHETSLEIVRFILAALASEHHGGRAMRLDTTN